MVSENFLLDFFRMGPHREETTAVPMPQCPWCGALPHASVGQCPAVKKIEYYPDGTIKSVEKNHGF
jgi:hypothetical protein